LATGDSLLPASPPPERRPALTFFLLLSTLPRLPLLD
jgi:hypothetical protein